MKKIVLLILATASVLLAANPAIKYLSSQSSTSILSLSGMSYWVAGQETDSQNLTQLGSSGAGDAQFGSTSGADSNDPTALPWYSTSDYDVTVDGVNYKYLSDNLVTNGTFDDGTGWTIEATWTISGGVANGNGAADANAEIRQNTLLTSGNLYVLEYTISNYSSGSLQGRLNTTGLATRSSNGTFTEVGVSTGQDLVFRPTSFQGSIDNVVVREVTANLGDHVYLPGTSGNYLSHPDSAAVSVTGDITIQVECALDDLTTVLGVFLGKWSGAGARSYFLCLDGSGTGKLRFYWSTDGTASAFATSSVATGFSNNQKGFFRVTVDVDNGASNADIKFWTSSDGETFSQLGTTQNAGSTISLYDSAQQVEIGTYGDGTSGLNTGSFYSAHIWDSDIGDTATSSAPTPVMNWRASSMTQSGGSDEESGGTWTINRSATGLKSTLVTRPVIVFNSAASTYLEVADHDDLDMGASDDFTVWVYGRNHGAPASTILEKYQNAPNGYQLYFASTNNRHRFRLYGGTAQSSEYGADTSTSASVIFGGVRDAGSTLTVYFDSDAGPADTDESTNLANIRPLRIGATSAPTPGTPIDLELFAAGVLKGTALSSDQLASLKTELDALLQGRTGE